MLPWPHSGTTWLVGITFDHWLYYVWHIWSIHKLVVIICGWPPSLYELGHLKSTIHIDSTFWYIHYSAHYPWRGEWGDIDLAIVIGILFVLSFLFQFYFEIQVVVSPSQRAVAFLVILWSLIDCKWLPSIVFWWPLYIINISMDSYELTVLYILYK